MVDWVFEDWVSVLLEIIEVELRILLLFGALAHWWAELHRFIKGFLQQTVFFYLIQDYFEVFLAGLRYFEINHWLVDQDQLVLEDVFSGHVSLTCVGFPNLNLVAVILAKTSKRTRFFSVFFGLLLWSGITVRKNLNPVVNSHIICHVIGEFLIVPLKLLFADQAFQFEQCRWNE